MNVLYLKISHYPTVPWSDVRLPVFKLLIYKWLGNLIFDKMSEKILAAVELHSPYWFEFAASNSRIDNFTFESMSYICIVEAQDWMIIDLFIFKMLL